MSDDETIAEVLRDGILPSLLSSIGGMLIGMGIGLGPRADPAWPLFVLGGMAIACALLIGLLARKAELERKSVVR